MKKIEAKIVADSINTFGNRITTFRIFNKRSNIMNTEKVNKQPSKLPIYCISDRFLEFEEWFAEFEDEINIELAETGADREMDFDSEHEFDKRYEMYLNAR